MGYIAKVHEISTVRTDVSGVGVLHMQRSREKHPVGSNESVKLPHFSKFLDVINVKEHVMIASQMQTVQSSTILCKP